MAIPSAVIQSRVKAKTDFSLEYDIGIVPGPVSEEIAIRNVTLMNGMFDSMWEGGRYRLANGGPVTPILKEVVGEGRDYRFKGQMRTGLKVGGNTVRGPGGMTYPLSTGDYTNDSLGGSFMRWTRVDGENGGSVLRLRNTGTDFKGIELRGQLWPDNEPSPGGPQGTQTPCLIEVEGRAYPATGRHYLGGLAGILSPIAIKTLGGYYDDAGTFVVDVNHADHGIVEDCAFWTPTIMSSNNQQGVNWFYRNVYAEQRPGVLHTTTAFDVASGGKIVVEGLFANNPSFKVVRTNAFSPNTNSITVTGLAWDGFNKSTDFLTLFEYYGNNSQGENTLPFNVNIQGHIARQYDRVGILPDSGPWDLSKTFIIPSGIPSWRWDQMWFKIVNLPTDHLSMTHDGAGFYKYNGGGVV